MVCMPIVWLVIYHVLDLAELSLLLLAWRRK